MATIPKDIRAALIDRLNNLFGSVELMCDGHRINLEVLRASESVAVPEEMLPATAA